MINSLHSSIEELNNLNDETNNFFELIDLLDVKSFNLVDFVKNLSTEKNKFKIASSSMNQINNLFKDGVAPEIKPFQIGLCLSGL